MAKATILDRLAGAMETLGKREGKALTPRQRVAAAQRWNSLADIGEGRLAKLGEQAGSDNLHLAEWAASKYAGTQADLEDIGLLESSGYRATNPFRFDWMGERGQYESRLKNYKPLTDAQYERMLELEEVARQRDLDAIHQEWYDNFIEPWRY